MSQVLLTDFSFTNRINRILWILNLKCKRYIRHITYARQRRYRIVADLLAHMNKGVMYDHIYSTLCHSCESINCSCSELTADRGTDRVSNELDLFADDVYCHTCAKFDCDCMEPVLRCSAAR